MPATPLVIPDVMLFEPKIFADARGAFFESFNVREFEAATGLQRDFVQDNHSVSAKGVLRGLHFQAAPYAQGKLVRVVVGAAFDVAVDIRRSSLSFGKWVGVELSAENRRQMWIPEGFAHGFLALTEGTEFLYKTTNYYAAGSDRSIRWDDPEIGIRWPIDGSPLLSPKDEIAPSLSAAEVFD